MRHLARRYPALFLTSVFGFAAAFVACGDTTTDPAVASDASAPQGNDASAAEPADAAIADASLVVDGGSEGGSSDAGGGADATLDAALEASADATADGADASDAATCPPFLAASVTASHDLLGGVCAIDLAGDLYCWDLDRAFPGKNPSHLYAPTKVTGIADAKSVAFGRSSVFVVLGDGSVQAWGDNDCGQLGDGSKTARATLGAVSGLTQVKQIVGSQYGSMFVINQDGSAASWGDVNLGTCALDSKQRTPTPFLVAGVSPLAVAMPSIRGCALLPDKSVACWIGALTYTASGPAGYRPATTTAISGLSDVAQVGPYEGNPAPGVDACARKNDGTVSCWLDTGAASAVSAFGSSVASLASGWRNACALRTDGSLHCWGPNSADFEGVVGDGTDIDRASPVPLTSLGTDVAQVSVGMRTACAIKKDKTLWCWGYRPGTGTNGIERSPVPIQRCL